MPTIKTTNCPEKDERWFADFGAMAYNWDTKTHICIYADLRSDLELTILLDQDYNAKKTFTMRICGDPGDIVFATNKKDESIIIACIPQHSKHRVACVSGYYVAF